MLPNPSPSENTEMTPSCKSTMPLQMYRPNPDPPPPYKQTTKEIKSKYNGTTTKEKLDTKKQNLKFFGVELDNLRKKFLLVLCRDSGA